MSENIAIFLTVLASSCLGMYFYYNEQNPDSEEDIKDDIETDDSNPKPEQIDDKDIYFGKKIYNPNAKSKRKKSKRGFSKKSFY